MNRLDQRPGGDSPIPALPEGVTLTSLENGLTIIVREDHSAPVVSAQAWCMSGSIHEGPWLGAGMSHALEHMLFKGTTTRPGSRIDQEVQENGGYMNAYTSFDRTVYHIDVPNTGARVAIDILCDIMQHATLPPEELEKEKQVIVREMDMNVDDPSRRASRRLFETAYTRSPYRFTVIGYRDVFDRLKHQDLLGYYQSQYAPNNVFYVVVGDIRAEEAVGQIRQCYAASKSRPLPPMVLPEEPRQTAPREIIEEAPIQLGYLHFAWHIPELRHPDVPVLDVLASLLGNGRSSRLYREVRDAQGLVNSVDAWTYSPGMTGLFGVSAVVNADKFSAARDAIFGELEKMRTGEVPSSELNKALKQFVFATLSTRKTMQGQAQDLGANWIAANDLGFSERYLDAVKKVTPADLQRVAGLYLTAENRTLYALLPEGAAPKPALVVTSAASHPARKFDLSNGLRLLVKEDHRLPFVEFRAVLKGGAICETPSTNGLAQLGTRMLLKGTARRSAEEIALAVEAVGGSLDSYAGNNSYGITAEVMNSDVDLGLDLVADVLRNPVFPAAALEREREVQLAAIRSQKDHLLQLAVKTMRRSLFGEIGYGLDSLGSETAVATVQTADLKLWQARFAIPNNCVLAIYGAVETPRIREAVEKAFSGWQASALPVESSSTVSPQRSGTTVELTTPPDKKQAVLVVGYPGTTLASQDRYPLELLQEACSDLGSRLFLRVREALGLAYYVGAQNFLGLSPGYFAFYAGTMPEKADLVQKELLAEAEMLRKEGLSAEELSRAKAKVIGQKKIARQELGGLAMSAALDELYGLGYTHSDSEDPLYEAVTVEQVIEVARKYLVADSAVICKVIPPAVPGPNS